MSYYASRQSNNDVYYIRGDRTGWIFKLTFGMVIWYIGLIYTTGSLYADPMMLFIMGCVFVGNVIFPSVTQFVIKIDCALGQVDIDATHFLVFNSQSRHDLSTLSIVRKGSR